MSLIATGLVTFCLNTSPGKYNEACNKATEAGTKQTGVYQIIDDAESKTNQLITKQGQDTLGKDAMSVLGSGGFVLKTYREKTLRFKLPNLGICDSINNEITPNSYLLKIKWSW